MHRQDLAGRKTYANGTLATSATRPPAEESASSAEYGLIRQWLTAILCAAEDPERVKGWGRRAIAVRLVLLALGQAAMVSGSSVVEFGTRNLALHSALSHRTVSRVLRILRDEPDPLIDLVSAAAGWPGPTATRSGSPIGTRTVSAGGVGELAASRRRTRRSWCSAARPALVYEALDQAEARGAEVARAARLSASATSAALRVLAEHGLAERRPGRLAPRSRRPGRRRRVDRRGRPAARARSAVQAGPGELAGPAPAVPAPVMRSWRRVTAGGPGRRGRVARCLPVAGALR